MKKLITITCLTFFAMFLFSQSQVSDEYSNLGFDYLHDYGFGSYVTQIDGSKTLFVWTRKNILKINLDDVSFPVEILDHRSECLTRSTFADETIYSLSESDLYQIDAASGETLVHLELDQKDTYSARKVGEHIYISGFQFDALYHSGLDELINLPHSRHYRVYGDQLIAIGNEVAFQEYGPLFHVDMTDGSIVVDYDQDNISNHTLFSGDENVDKIFFSSVNNKLFSLRLSDYQITLECPVFLDIDKDLVYHEDKVYYVSQPANEPLGGTATVHLVDTDNCWTGERIGAYTIELNGDLISVHKIQDSDVFISETRKGIFKLKQGPGVFDLTRLNKGNLDFFEVIENNLVSVSSSFDFIYLAVHQSSSTALFEPEIAGKEIHSYMEGDDLICIYTNQNKMYKAQLNIISGEFAITELAENGLAEGPYLNSSWKYRSGYFYSVIDNRFHYKTESGMVKQVGDLEWNGEPWINSDGQLVGVSGQDLIIYDLKNETFVSSIQSPVVAPIRNIVQIQGEYFIITTDRIYNLEISNGAVVENSMINFTPILSSPQRTIGKLFSTNTYANSLVSFDGVFIEVLVPVTSSNLSADPINQLQGSYSLRNGNRFMTFNEITDELVEIDKEGFYFNTQEVRYKGENCFIDINNQYVYYYSEDTLVWKPLKIEGDHQLVYGYLANNTVFSSSSPFEKTYGEPFAQTIDDDVIELESMIGKVSISDAIFVDDLYYLLSFDSTTVFLHSLSKDLSEAEQLATFSKPRCHYHESYYFLGPDYEGDINMHIVNNARGVAYYQYQQDKQNVALLFDPSSENGRDIRDLKFYDDEGMYFTANDGGNNWQMWMLSYEQDPTSTKDAEGQVNEFLIYPNPFQNSVSFKREVQSVCIYDAMGKRVWMSECDSNILSVEGLETLSSGIYFVHFEVNGEKKIEKVVKY